MAWALAMCDGFVPPGESVTQAKVLVELMWDNPTIFFPTAEEEPEENANGANMQFYQVSQVGRHLFQHVQFILLGG